jgi:hypothetical protein
MVTFRSKLELSSPTGPMMAVAGGLAMFLALVWLVAR